MIRIHCQRPFATVEEMDQVLIDKHNALVKPSDTVIMLGDVARRDHERYVRALNGHKILVFGNHDRRMRDSALRLFDLVVGSPEFPGIMGKAIDGQYVVFSHFPLWSWNGSFHGSWCCYGHCHGTRREFQQAGVIEGEPFEERPPWRIAEFMDALACAVDVDAWEWAPVPWEVLAAKLSARIPAWKERRRVWTAVEEPPGRRSELAAENHKWRDQRPICGDR